MESRLQAAGASDASLAVWTSDANAVGSFTARSARILRSTSTPAVFKPLMNLEYDRPCGRTAALIRAIHNRRNWPLRSRRSRYAYTPECRTCSLAIRYRIRRLPVYPFAASRISRRFFFAWTERFTLAMRSPREKSLELLLLVG